MIDINFLDIIQKKKDNVPLTREEIKYFVDGVCNDSIPDYQISAFLMAICFNPLNDEETAFLTMEMTNSGNTVDLSQIDGIKVDKHSTGGVADTTTLILAPLVASCGLNVIKMSGRGLGHTGGTLDKLESIPGFNINLNITDAIEKVKEHSLVIMGQTSSLAPADKKLYALRDVTQTVDSIPLIASSIMSKKLAAGADGIVLDIKCGNGAFMKDINDARQLARTMVNIGKIADKKVIGVITNMNEPLGNSIGNSFDVIEAIEVLKGNEDGTLKEVALTLGSYMLILGNIVDEFEKGKKILEENIKNGKGLEKFRELIISQGGNPSIIENYNLFEKAPYKAEILSDKSGYITDFDTYNLGIASVYTGAGRFTKKDEIHHGAGIILHKRIGDFVEKGECIMEVFSKDKKSEENAVNILKSSYKQCEIKPEKRNYILDVIR